MARLEAEVEGRLISTHAMVIDEIGNDEGDAPIEILIGALAMQQWGIRLVPDEEKLDLSHYPEKFLEFGLKPFGGIQKKREASQTLSDSAVQR